jgi:hypothetical protein
MTNRADIALVMKGRQSVFLSESATNLKRKDEGKVTATLCINAATELHPFLGPLGMSGKRRLRVSKRLQSVCEALPYWCLSTPSGSKGLRREVAECPMWTLSIILLAPRLDDRSCVVDRRNPVLVQAFLS